MSNNMTINTSITNNISHSKVFYQNELQSLSLPVKTLSMQVESLQVHSLLVTDNLEKHRNIQPYDTINYPQLHLQWFAAEDEGRSFSPTEQRIRKARQEGRVAKSPELTSSLILISVVALLWGLGSFLVKNLREVLSGYFQRINSIEKTKFYSNEGIQFGLYFIKIMWPILLIAIVIAILGNVVQFGWAPSTKPITPDFTKVAFRMDKWLEKVFSIQGWYTTGSSLLKIIIVTAIAGFNIYLRLDEFSATVAQPFIEGIKLGAIVTFSVLLESALLLFVLAILDYQFQRYLYLEQLKMSFQDVKEEFKESEGDPEVKKRIQSRMQDYMTRNIKKEVTESDVLVTNPTHFAVAMKYDRQSMDAPKVTAKGEDEMALRMKRYAKDAEIPIIENKPLARALYTDLDIGDEIPEKYYEAVVLVFQEVYKMKGVTV